MIKTYTITVTKEEDKIVLRRECNGFTPIELLGLLEQIQLEILQQMAGEIKPDLVERIVVTPKSKKPPHAQKNKNRLY